VPPLDPDEISAAGLPRSPLGGYKAGPTEQLLKQAAWDYRQLVEDCKKLAVMVGELKSRIAELEAQTRYAGPPEEGANPDELAANVLATAQRTALELLESARIESEAMLRNAFERSREIEVAALSHSEGDVQDVAALHALVEGVRNELRASLESILALGETMQFTEGTGREELLRTAPDDQASNRPAPP
jgi:cell division septum initiation protein DivIVA